jgi:predicted DNA-binding protein YlxM (UPF0122 family)
MAAAGKLTKEVLVKLEQAAAIDASVEEMAFYCDVSRQTIYQWLKDNPELSDKIDRLRNKPILKARQTVVNRLDDSYQNSMDYLKRKKRAEFGDSVEHTGEAMKIVFDDAFARQPKEGSSEPS